MGKIKVKTVEGYELEFDSVEDVRTFVSGSIKPEAKVADTATATADNIDVDTLIDKISDEVDGHRAKKLWHYAPGGKYKKYDWKEIAYRIDLAFMRYDKRYVRDNLFPADTLEKRFGFPKFMAYYYNCITPYLASETKMVYDGTGKCLGIQKIGTRRRSQKYITVNAETEKQQQLNDNIPETATVPQPKAAYGSISKHFDDNACGNVFGEMDSNKTATFAYAMTKLGYNKQSFPIYYAKLKAYAKKNMIDMTEYFARGKAWQAQRMKQINDNKAQVSQTADDDSIEKPFPVLEHFDMNMLPVLKSMIEKMLADKDTEIRRHPEGDLLNVSNWSEFITEFMYRSPMIAAHYCVPNKFKLVKGYSAITYGGN